METPTEKSYCSERLCTSVPGGRWCVGDVEGGCLDYSAANSEKEGELASPVYIQAESLL